MSWKEFLDLKAKSRISPFIAYPFFAAFICLVIVILWQSPFGIKAAAMIAPEKITHDGSRTGPRVGYASTCNPEEGVVIYENEKMPFVTNQGEHVLWTQGDIDCYRQKDAQTAVGINTQAVPSVTPTKNSKTIINDTDPIISCSSSAPNCNGQSIKVKQSMCSKIICCQVGNKWSIYASVEQCTKDQNASVNNQPISPIQVVPQNNSKPTISCIVNYPCTGNSFTYQVDADYCKTIQHQAADLCQSNTYIPTEPKPSPTMTDQQANQLIEKYNRDVMHCQSEVVSYYNPKIQSCNILYGASSATEACEYQYKNQLQKEYDACGKTTF